MTRGRFAVESALLLLATASLSAAQTVVGKVNYAIVGAGPAGYVLAERLSRNSSVTVTLLEAGPDAGNDPLVQTPADYFFGREYLWNYTSQPDANLGNVPPPNLWQGRALGGGTAVNAMLYSRGSASVFDEWAQISGNKGLAWNSLVQDFIQTTTYQDQPTNYQQSVNASAFGNGPLAVSRSRTIYPFDQPIASLFQSQLGLHEIDFVSGGGIGYSYGLATITESNRTRSFAENSFGTLLAGRHNVNILTNAWASKIGFQGTTARSVFFTNTLNNKTFCLNANEIILTSGAINTPQLLMLSGVGPANQLQPLGIPVVANISAIGSQLQDHHYSVLEWQAAGNIETVWQFDQNATGKAIAEQEYQQHHDGPLGENTVGIMAGQRIPDSVFAGLNSTHYQNLPSDRAQLAYLTTGTPFLPNGPNVSTFAAFAAVVQPEAAGAVKLASADYRVPPQIFSNYYGSPADRAAVVYGFKQLRALLNSPSLSPYLLEEIFPGANVTSDAQIWQAIQTGAQSWHHPVGTTALGTVLDSNWRVKGLHGLRVVGASAIPTLPTVPIQAAVYALAHRAAQDIATADGSVY